jgi:hypothetical protein
MVIHNPKLTQLFNAFNSKAVLLLGRFSRKRLNILKALHAELRYEGYAPMIFDFEQPTYRDTIEVISTLAGLSRFVIADLTQPKSSPLESHVITPHLSIPFVPIIMSWRFCIDNPRAAKYESQ